MTQNTFTDDFDALVKRIESSSEYKKKEHKCTTMSVLEMGNLLGLKKTERYWLVHKNFFETKVINGKMRVVIDSFEKWYANQAKYKKVTGEEPGKELKEKSYSPQDIAAMLGIADSDVYEIIRNNNIEYEIVDYRKRIPKEAFFKWYNSQKRFRLADDKEKDRLAEAASLSMPEMAKLLGIKREKVYNILYSDAYRDMFEYVYIAERKRITKASFEQFLDSQGRYKLINPRMYTRSSDNDSRALADYIRKQKTINTDKLDIESNYLTINQAASIASVSRRTITNWISREHFTAKRVGNLVRIPKEDLLLWLKQKER